MRHFLVVLFAIGCGSASPSGNDGGAVDFAATPSSSDGGSDGGLVAARPYNFHVPTGYDKSKPTPLVILLHGYSASGAVQEAYFKLTPVSDAHTFLYAYPDGTIDSSGNRFWNATDACCNFFGSPVDDVAYLNAIIDDVERKYNVDTKRVYLVGHSNGGFMSHRMACDASPRIAALVALAGDNWKDMSKCNPTSPVAALQVHGTLDTTVQYGGGDGVVVGAPPYPSAHDSIATWAVRNGCPGDLAATGVTLDLDSVLPGNETRVEGWSGCPKGIDVQLWSIQGAGHIPNFNSSWGESVWGFFSAHPKP